MKCTAIDDEPIALAIISRFCERLGGIELQTFTNPLEGGDVRTVLRLHPALAPIKCAVLPLQKNKLGDKAKEVYAKLARKFMCEYDETGSIGKRYRRADEAGTPFCVTVDFDTLETNKVTVRDRDTMQQTLVDVDELPAWLEEKMDF